MRTFTEWQEHQGLLTEGILEKVQSKVRGSLPDGGTVEIAETLDGGKILILTIEDPEIRKAIEIRVGASGDKMMINVVDTMSGAGILEPSLAALEEEDIIRVINQKLESVPYEFLNKLRPLI